MSAPSCTWPKGSFRLTPDPIDEIRRAQAAELVDEDGHGVVLALAPRVPDAEIDRLGDELGVPLPTS